MRLLRLHIFNLKATTLCLVLMMCTLTGSIWAQSTDPMQASYSEEARGRFSQAASVLEPLLRQTPNSPFLLSRVGWLYYLQGRHADAIAKYSQALSVKPKAYDIRLAITLPLMAQQRWKEAADEAKKVLSESPWDYNAHLKLLYSEEGQRAWKDMLAHSTELAERYPLDPTVLVYVARSYAWLGQIKEAKNAYIRVLEILPTHIEATQYVSKNP